MIFFYIMANLLIYNIFSDSPSRSFYYHIHFIDEPSSNDRVNKDSERNLRHVRQEDDDSNDSIPEDAYDRDYDNDDNSDEEEDLIQQKHDLQDHPQDLQDDEDYLDENSEGDEDETNFDNENDDLDVTKEDNLSDEDEPQNNPKACKEKPHLLFLLRNLLDATTMKMTLVWKCPY